MAGNTNNTSPEARATENQTKPPTNPANDMATMLEQNKPVDDQQHPPKEEEKEVKSPKLKKNY